MIVRDTLRWFALRTGPQEEQLAIRILRRQDLLVSLPVEERYRKENRYKKGKVAKQYPIMPGYILIGWGPGPIPWWSALRFRIIKGVISITPPPSKDDRYPAPIPSEIPHMQANRMLEKDVLTAPSFYKFQRTWGEYNPGDEVRVVAGAYEGWQTKVIAVSGREAKILLPLFGSDKEVTVPADHLEKAA